MKYKLQCNITGTADEALRKSLKITRLIASAASVAPQNRRFTHALTPLQDSLVTWLLLLALQKRQLHWMRLWWQWVGLVGWWRRDGWRGSTTLSQMTHSICCSKQGFVSSSNTSLLTKSTFKGFPWKCCLFSAKMVHLLKPTSLLLWMQSKEFFVQRPSLLTFAQGQCGVVFCWVKG